MDAIRNALEAVCAAANAHLQSLTDRGEAWLVLTSLVGEDGSPNEAARDKLVMTVWGIAGSAAETKSPPAGRGPAVGAPPLNVDLRLIFMANFAEVTYPDGLAAISRLMAYLHQNPVFDSANAPGLDPSIGPLTMDAVDLGPTDTGCVLGMLGARYLPSVFYTLRIPVAS